MASGGMDGWVNILGTMVDNVASAYVTDIVEAMATALTPILAFLLFVYWTLFGWAIIRGEVQDGIVTGVWNHMKMTVIATLALTAATYNSYVSTLYIAMRDWMATVLSTAVAVGDAGYVESLSGATIWSEITEINNAGLDICFQITTDAGMFDIGAYLAAFIFGVGITVLCLAAMVIAILSSIYGTFFIATGPLFITCLMFKPTQRFFDGWLGQVISTIILSWIGMFVAGFAVSIVKAFATAISDPVTGISNANAFGTSLQFLGLCLIFTFIIMQAPSWASAVSGGSSMAMGGAQAGFVGRMMRRNSARQPNSSGNALAQASLMSRAASATGRGISSGANAAGRIAASGMRRAQFQLAALRGRRG